MPKPEPFSVVIEYPREIEIGSVVSFDGRDVRVTILTKIEPITERMFLVKGYGKLV